MEVISQTILMHFVMAIQFIPYPQGVWRIVARVPLYFYQAGLGWMLRPFNLLILTTQGRRSSLERHAVLEYRRHGSKLYLISAWGERPQWYKNLLTNPTVTVQFNGQGWKAIATEVDDAGEALRALYMFKRTSRLYDVILASMSSASTIDLRTLKAVSSEFTVIRLDLVQGQVSLKGIQPKYRWVAPFLFATALLVMAWSVWARINQKES
jgi:deazaflavin-dependent oxidoreductase (nitroreductase family)